VIGDAVNLAAGSRSHQGDRSPPADIGSLRKAARPTVRRSRALHSWLGEPGAGVESSVSCYFA